MPVSKKRKKKRVQPVGPPPSKQELAAKKKKITWQQILIYVFSALIILSLAISFIIGSVSPTTPHGGATGNQDIILATPIPDNNSASEDGSAPAAEPAETTETE